MRKEKIIFINYLDNDLLNEMLIQNYNVLDVFEFMDWWIKEKGKYFNYTKKEVIEEYLKLK